MAESTLGGEVFALSEMVNHTLLLKDCFSPFAGLNQGVVGLEDCGSLVSHLKTKRMIAKEFLIRHFLSIRQALEGGELASVY